ncbi:MAG: hypothetical protein ACRC3Y_13340 [Romboutsia sp.]|uniref:hypothetical protein n=1 Tax=Romboutsia sp. TaxID=1965302 RepID=UPI003F30B6D4
MDFVIDGVVDFKYIENVELVDFINIYKTVNVYEKIFVNNFENTNSNNSNVSFEITNVSLSLDDIKIKKISNKDTHIYCISFIYNLNINLSINSKLEQLKLKDVCSHSFTYKDIDSSNLDLLSINLEIRNLDNKLGFNINFVVVDRSIQNQNLLIKRPIIENNENMDIQDLPGFKNYSYIDIDQEFI